jgi:hypothetical protein
VEALTPSDEALSFEDACALVAEYERREGFENYRERGRVFELQRQANAARGGDTRDEIAA